MWLYIIRRFEKGGEIITAHEYIDYLINTYENLIFSICYKFTNNYIDAQDMTQETYLAAFRFLKKNKKNYMEHEKAWICKIAVNKCLSFKEKPKLEVVDLTTEDIKNPIEHLIANENVEDTVLDIEVQEYFQQCCADLKKPYDEIAREHFILGKSADIIATERGIKRKTIETQIRRAREKLRKIYRKE